MPIELRHLEIGRPPEQLQMPIEVGHRQQPPQCRTDREQRRHHIAVKQAGARKRLPEPEHAHDDRDPHRGDGIDPERRRRRQFQLTGLSHRSIRSVRMKKHTLTRITKQIAA